MKRLARQARSLLRPDVAKGPRYFIASPYKTATTTVGAALIELGAGTRDMRYDKSVMRSHKAEVAALNKSIPAEMTARDFIETRGAEAGATLAGLRPYLAQYDVFSDAPLGHSHVHPFILKALVPQARFIWVHRPRRAWLASVRAWEEAHPQVYPRHVEWARDPQAREDALCRMWKRRARRFRRLAADFPGDCLTMDIGDLESWDVLAAFCGLPAPDGAPAARNVSAGR